MVSRHVIHVILYLEGTADTPSETWPFEHSVKNNVK